MEDIIDDSECKICCEKKIEDKLDCNHPICLDCCKNLSDLLCPFCKQVLKGPMITDEIVNLIKTKNEMEKTKKEFYNFCTSFFISKNLYNPELLSDFYTNEFIYLLDIPFDKWKKYIIAYSFFVKDNINLMSHICDLKIPSSGMPEDIVDDIKELVYTFNKSMIPINAKIKEKNKIIMAEGHSKFIEAYFNGLIEECDIGNINYMELPNAINRLFYLTINNQFQYPVDDEPFNEDDGSNNDDNNESDDNESDDNDSDDNESDDNDSDDNESDDNSDENEMEMVD